MTSGIYQIINNKTKKCYIGQSINIEDRYKQHLSLLANNNHPNKEFQNDYNNVENARIYLNLNILEETSNLYEKEIMWMFIFHDIIYNSIPKYKNWYQKIHWLRAKKDAEKVLAKIL